MPAPVERRRELSLRSLRVDERPVLDRLWQLYRHDLSEFVDSLPDQRGLFKTGRLGSYRDNPDCAVYLLWAAEVPLGFVVVDPVGSEPRRIGDFFVVRRMRRAGIGSTMALAAISAFPGRWEIAFQERNRAGARLWRRVATIVAGDRWTEERRPVPGKPEVPPDCWIAFVKPGRVAAGPPPQELALDLARHRQ